MTPSALKSSSWSERTNWPWISTGRSAPASDAWLGSAAWAAISRSIARSPLAWVRSWISLARPSAASKTWSAVAAA
jgi:hypothetical protein